jgi:DNA-binding CsgD family transcriptional regulator
MIACSSLTMAAVSIWFWIVGYSPAFVGTTQLIFVPINPERLCFFLLVIIAGCLMSALCKRVNCNGDAVSLVVYILMAMGTLVFGLAGYQTLIDPPFLASTGAVLMGFGYGWSLTMLLAILYRYDSLWQIAIVVVLSSVLSTLGLGLIHFYADATFQVFCSVVMVVVLACGTALLQRELLKKGVLLDNVARPDRSVGKGPLKLDNEQGYYLIQLLVVCIIVIALRSINPGGLWGDQRSPSLIADISEFVPTMATALIFLAVGLLAFRFHTSNERNERLQLPYLVLIASLLALNFLKPEYGETPLFLVFSSVTERVCLAIFSFTMVAATRKLPFPPLMTLGLAVAFNHLVAMVWMVFFEELSLVAGLVVSSICYLLVLVLAFMGRGGFRWGGQTKVTNDTGIYESLQQRCRELVQEGQLTNRESDVLFLLAQGRSIPFIQNELVLSEGTVKTHVKHIYEKLAIHTKQDLLDLVEHRD